MTDLGESCTAGRWMSGCDQISGASSSSASQGTYLGTSQSMIIVKNAIWDGCSGNGKWFAIE